MTDVNISKLVVLCVLEYVLIAVDNNDSNYNSNYKVKTTSRRLELTTSCASKFTISDNVFFDLVVIRDTDEVDISLIESIRYDVIKNELMTSDRISYSHIRTRNRFSDQFSICFSTDVKGKVLSFIDAIHLKFSKMLNIGIQSKIFYKSDSKTIGGLVRKTTDGLECLQFTLFKSFYQQEQAFQFFDDNAITADLGHAKVFISLSHHHYDSILFYSILFYSNLFYSILFYSILF
jgi:hypothetical protein